MADTVNSRFADTPLSQTLAALANRSSLAETAKKMYENNGTANDSCALKIICLLFSRYYGHLGPVP